MGTIINAIEGYESAATKGGQLQVERAQAMDYYLGRAFGNEVDGRSQVVSHDVADTLEWIKPSLLRIFTSGDEIVRFDPVGPEDVEGAQQETDFVNFIITQKNDWFRTAYVWFMDALLQKNGYVKAWYDEKTDVSKERYEGLSEDQFAFIAKDEEFEILEHSAQPDPVALMQLQQAQQAGMLQPGVTPEVPQIHTVVGQKKKTYGCVKFIELPPERCIVANQTQSVDLDENCPFFEHWEMKTISSLREEGFEVPDDIGDEVATFTETEDQARDRFNENQVGMPDDTNDPSMRRVKVRECWIRFDQDGDGIAELRHVIAVGQTELLNEDCDEIPAAALTPIIMPHRHIGISVADCIVDLQLIKSTLLRGFLDNLYLANNGRYGIDAEKVNLDDMLTSRPGGVVRTQGNPTAAIMPLTHQSNFAPVLQGLEYIDSVRENRTGVTKYNQGLDANSLNKTATGISQIMNAAQARIELIARVFAETGVKRLFSIVHQLTMKHAKKPEVMRLRNKWIPVDPRQWKKRQDMTISVGLGTGNKEQMLAHLQNIIALQGQLMPLGLASPKTIHHAAEKLTQNAGFRDADAFWVQPQEGQQQPPPPDPAVEAKKAELQLKAQEGQQALQMKQQEHQATVAMEREKLALEREKAAVEAQAMREKVAAEIQLARERAMAEMQLARERSEAEIDLARQRAIADAQIRRESNAQRASQVKQ